MENAHFSEEMASVPSMDLLVYNFHKVRTLKISYALLSSKIEKMFYLVNKAHHFNVTNNCRKKSEQILENLSAYRDLQKTHFI